ncbi:MAG: bifunctional UDP-N-acetylglucosamine diphosphorylase/glucosamine-1-phosphate N-acetyltransferase GlmU [Coriobacteriia bacterium]
MSAALILAAGEGTRMKSDLPKVVHPVLGVPMIVLVVGVAREAGLEPVVVTGHEAEKVEALLEGVRCVRQPEQLGTGHAVMCARAALDGVSGSLVVLAGDTPLLRAETLRAIVEARESSGAACVLLTAVAEDPSGYGRIIRADDGSVRAIVEQKDLAPGQEAIREVNTGTYCFDAQALLSRLERLDRDNAQGEYYLTDMVEHMVEEGLSVLAHTVEDASETMGVNTRVQLAEATAVLQRRINTDLMLAGVTMTAPGLVWVSPGVSVGRDVVLEPMTFLAGSTVVEDGAHVGPNCRIVDSRVGERARVDSSVVLGAEVGPDANVGPMAYLRPGTVLGEGAKAGTFVEMKKTIVGDGSKVPHLSYMGDASIGKAVNVGAGSITCNYDGFSKHGTTIGDGAFIGSDTMFVAPVTVGPGAVIGAGSVITEDVPEGALGVARQKQRNVSGWAEKWRQRLEASRRDRSSGSSTEESRQDG